MRVTMQNLSLLLLVFFAFSLPAWAQQADVSGMVVEKSTNEPLIGATVIVKGTRNGTTTDIDGKFNLKNVKSSATLVVSYVGFKSQEVAVNGRSDIRIELDTDHNLLDEVVVIGYGTMDKKEVTSAISHVGSKDFQNISTADPSMMIQGKVPGVSITNTGAADPNVGASIQVRGVSSRAAGLGPLIVVDGVPGGNLSNINPNDIESFDILKDGAASAIYGTRGSNGVILVTTKKGSKDGNVHASYRADISWDFVNRELDMLSADEYRELCVGKQSSAVDFGGNYDWFDGVSRTGFAMRHTLSMNGGNEKTNYRATVDYRDSHGIDLRSTRQEYGARVAINHTTKGGLFTFSLNAAPRVISRDNSYWAVFRNAVEANPTTPLMHPDDPTRYNDFTGQVAENNPVETQVLPKSHNDIKLLEWNGIVRLNLLPLFYSGAPSQTLTTQLMFSDSRTSNDGSTFEPSTTNGSINGGRKGSASRSYGASRTDVLEWITNYGLNVGRNSIKAMVGYSYQYEQNSGFNASNKDFANDGLGSDNLGSGTYAKEEGEVGMGSYRNDSKLISFFGRVSYNWDNRYYATASLRHEGSSRFGKNHKWGNFPAFSLGWRISEEKFMESTRGWLNELKLRGDYGVTGNQEFGNYKSLNTMSAFGEYVYNGQYFNVWGVSKNVNPDLKWEKGKNWNIGVDFSVLDNRISGSLNYYQRRQQDLLGDYDVPVPPYLYGSAFVNVGTMENKGFEFQLNFNLVNTKDFSYSFDIIGSTLSNKFLSFSNSEFTSQSFYNTCGTENPYPYYNLQRVQEGKRIGSFYMWRYAGVSEDGQWIVYDKNGNQILAEKAGEEDRTFVGNGLPKFTGSMSHNFRYRNFDLSLFFRGAFGFHIFNTHAFYYGTPAFNGNQLRIAHEKNSVLSVDANPIACDYFLERGDYFKLDMISLGYTLNLQKTRFLDSVRFFATVRNLFTITGFSGVDPSTYQVNGLTPGATGSRTYYPTTRQVIVGVQIDL